MARIPDLVRDSKLETHFPPESEAETIHTFQGSDPASGRRLVTRSERWRRERKIGRGVSGSVWLEKCVDNGRPDGVEDGTVRAVKQIEITRARSSINYNSELEAIAKFSHSKYVRCFVKSYGWYEGPGQLFIAMEYFEHGDLLDYLNQKPPLPESEAQHIASQILDGLEMMHDNGFAHRDLKPNNILIISHPPGEWWVKLADFGISKRIEEHFQDSTTLKGTPRYFAPELWGFVNRGSTYASDIWALGEILFEILTKTPAFTTASLATYTTQQQFPVSNLLEAGVSQTGVEFVLAVMHPYPDDRMTTASAKSHAWIASIIPDHSQNTGREQPIPYDTRTLSPGVTSSSAMFTQGSASWSVTSSGASTSLFHGTPASTTTSPDPSHEPSTSAVVSQKAKDPSENNQRTQTADSSPLLAELKYKFQRARILSREKHTEEADSVFRQALAGQERILGPNHRETLNSVQWLGISLDQQGRYKEAERTFKRAYKRRKIELGSGNEDTLYSAQWLGISLSKQGHYHQAKRVFQKTLAGQEKNLRPDHEHTLYTAYWLGISMDNTGHFKNAEKNFLRCNCRYEDRSGPILGPAHEDTLSSQQWLGNSLDRQDRWKESEVLFYQAHQGREKTLGFDHPHTLHSAQCLGVSLYKQNRYEDAAVVLRETLQRQEDVLGPDHEDTVYTRKVLEKAERRGRSRSRVWLSETTSRTFSSGPKRESSARPGEEAP